MPEQRPADDAAIREQAYYFWEEDGRPEGRETEYWMRAVIALSGKSQMATLTKPAPKAKAKPSVKEKPVAEAKPVAKAVPEKKAAASKTKAAPTKAEPAKKPKKK